MIGIKRIIILLAVLLPMLALAQTRLDIEKAKPWELKSYARQAAEMGDVYLAIDYYERYLEKRPDKYKVAFDLGRLYQRARDYKQALTWFDRIWNETEGGMPLALYYKAVMQQHIGEYADAETNFLAFKKAYRGFKDSKRYSKLAKLHVAQCQAAPQLLDSVLEVKLTHLDTSINKPHIELSPIPMGENAIAYASLRSDSVPEIDLSTDDYKVPHRQFYLANRNGKQWEGAGRWDVPFNNPDVETGNGAFSPNGNEFYFTQCAPNFLGEMTCGIWRSVKDGDDWLPAEPLPDIINDQRYTSTMPTVGTETKKGYTVLYFASNRPGGKGGMDIWYTIYDGRKEFWKEPKNAGTKVNTAGDEMAPFYDEQTRNLYFSSDGWPGLGGLDIQRTTGELRKFVPPANVGVPFNSSADDLYMVIGKNREEGFFVSNREGGTALTNPTCCDDIYFFSWTEFLYLAVEGTVLEAADGSKDGTTPIAGTGTGKTTPMDGARVTISILDAELGSIVLETKTTGPDGRYHFDTEPEKQYSISVERADYFTRSASYSTLKAEKSDTTAMPPFTMMKIVKEQAIELENIYYDFDKASLTPRAKTTLEEVLLPILRDNPSLVVEIGSHTDSKGANDYNQKLSKERAQSVVNYLIEGGIQKKRLRYKGYGESNLKVQDETNGTWNEEAQQKNRRTEFKVVGTVKVKKVEDDDY